MTTTDRLICYAQGGVHAVAVYPSASPSVHLSRFGVCVKTAKDIVGFFTF